MVKVGKLVKVPLREVWPHEAIDFTPWLLGNPDYLAEVLGVELELTTREHGVGPFSLDLIGKDLSNNSVIIVENQLEKTNHDHLGKLITYAANTDAVTVVWIAKEFTEEHRQAIDFLNELSGDSGKGRFYGIEVGAVRIGNSEPAAQLKVVAQPNDTHASQAGVVRDALEPTGRRLIYRDFWKKFIDVANEIRPGLTNLKAGQAQNWLDVNQTRGRLARVSLVFNRNSRANVQLYIDNGDSEDNRELFAYLSNRRTQIESETNFPLSWESPEGKRMCRIVAYMPGEWDVSMADRHDELIRWFIEFSECFKRVFIPLIEQYLDEIQKDRLRISRLAIQSDPASKSSPLSGQR